VSIGQWYVSRGRIPRRVFWLHYVLPIFAVGIVAMILDAMLGLWLVAPASEGGPEFSSGTGLLSTVAWLGTLVPSISSNVTRLHDRGLPAWLLLLALIPVVGQLALFGLTGFVPGHRGRNRYGPPSRSGPEPAEEPLYPPPTWS
jgi:uncharacterized membrane protein YhaH (DUF805 family)